VALGTTRREASRHNGSGMRIAFVEIPERVRIELIQRIE